jgi:hypothetical protein
MVFNEWCNADECASASIPKAKPLTKTGLDNSTPATQISVHAKP